MRTESLVSVVVEYIGLVQVLIVSRQVFDAQKLVAYLLGDLFERAVLVDANYVYFCV